uniref:Uncharacterized protein n=1 Tax=Medicago truncatula TaxID=3880 RepID=I3SAN8_MEDTR|nr:unknown [Medicago truncatula]
MAAPLLLRQALLLRACFHNYKHFTVRTVTARHRLWCSAAAINPPSEKPNDKPNSVWRMRNLIIENGRIKKMRFSMILNLLLCLLRKFFIHQSIWMEGH